MFARIARDYPLPSITVLSGLLASFYPLSVAVFPSERNLSPMSGMGFLFAASVAGFTVCNALYAERMVRSDPPLWQVRMAVAQGIHWFVAMVVLMGDQLEPVESSIWLGTALVYGAFMSRLTPRSEMMFGSEMFDLDQPLWTKPVGKFITTWSAVALVGIAGAVTVFAPRTEYGLFVVVFATPFVLPFGIKNRTWWRERDWTTFLVSMALMVGVFGTE